MLPLKPISPIPKFYKLICKQLNRPLNNEIKNGLSETEFILRVDLLGKQDIEPILLLFKSCKFKVIILQGGQDQLENSKKLNKSTIHTTSQKQFSLTPQFTEVFKVCCQILGKSLEIISFGIRDLRLNNEAIQCLSQCIQSTQSIKELELRSCSLTTQNFALLAKSIQQNSSLIALDLQRNFLTDGSGILIQRVLEEHSSRRDRLEYVYRSRGETPEEDLSLNGINELNLSYNSLDTLFVKDLEYFLKNDKWLKSLNLRGNAIDEIGIKKLSEVLDRNQTIISLDIRENPGATSQLSRVIYLKLVRNMNNLKEQNSLLANVSAIPKQNSSSSTSYQQDQESPMISFGDKILEQNITKQHSNSSKKDIVQKTRFQQEKQEQQILTDEVQIDEVGLELQQQQCQSCQRITQQLKRSEQIIKLLKQENQMLKQQLGRTGQQDQGTRQYSFQQHSTSNVLNVLWQNDHQQQNNQSQQHGDEDMINRIEYMMNELTRMMDSLENQNSATNHNLTAHLSSTMLGQNNNTHVIYARDQGDQPFMNMNILDVNNMSGPPPQFQQQQNDENSDNTFE